jgi:hypothetical protein
MGAMKIYRIAAAPRYILAKGGITSYDIASKALGVQRGPRHGADHPRCSRLAPQRGLTLPG